MAIPAMAPALRWWWWVWVAEVWVAFVPDIGGGDEWSMVIILGMELAVKSACETEKFPCSKSTSRYASCKNARPKAYSLAVEARRRGKKFVPLG